MAQAFPRSIQQCSKLHCRYLSLRNQMSMLVWTQPLSPVPCQTVSPPLPSSHSAEQWGGQKEEAGRGQHCSVWCPGATKKGKVPSHVSHREVWCENQAEGCAALYCPASEQKEQYSKASHTENSAGSSSSSLLDLPSHIL